MRIAWMAAGALLAVVAGFVAVNRASALSANAANSELSPYIQPAPMVAKLPADGGSINASVALNQSACLYVGTGKCARIDCKAGQCDYRATAQQSDGGWPAFPDGGLALPGDVTLPADTPEATCLPASLDSICAFFEAAGTLQVVPRYP